MNEPQQINVQIPLASYIADSDAGKVRIVKLNGVVHYTAKRFDEATGKPIPHLIPLDRTGVENAKKQCEAQLAALTRMLADIDSAEERLN